MKKLILIALITVFIFRVAQAQDMGYRTFDIGAEYQWVNNSPGLNLQVASNATTHHSIIGSIGVKTAFRPITGTHNNEKGKGFGGSLGYRYYFTVTPKGLFLGARAHLWSLGMYRTASNTAPSTHVLIAQPSAEIGYTALINDLFFITVYASGGQQVTISSGGDNFGYGKGFVTAGGISAGWRF